MNPVARELAPPTKSEGKLDGAPSRRFGPGMLVLLTLGSAECRGPGVLVDPQGKDAPGVGGSGGGKCFTESAVGAGPWLGPLARCNVGAVGSGERWTDVGTEPDVLSSVRNVSAISGTGVCNRTS
jgi:hypothetical protein